MKTNKIISFITSEKKGFNLDNLNGEFYDKKDIINISKSGELVHVEYEHLSIPLGKTKKVVLMKHQFFGLCIGVVKRGLSTILKLRNVIKKKPLEFSFYVYSPLVFKISKVGKKRYFNNRAKIYFLGKKPLRYSRLRLEKAF